MNTKADAPEFKLDGMKWFLVFLLLGVGLSVWSNWLPFIPVIDSVLYRSIALVTLTIIALLVAVQTKKGHDLWELVKESRVEMRRVVWPTQQETTQMTLIVAVVVLIVALILWGMDSLLGTIIKGLIS